MPLEEPTEMVEAPRADDSTIVNCWLYGGKYVGAGVDIANG